MGIRSLSGQSSSTGASTSVDRGRFQADLGWDNTILTDSWLTNGELNIGDPIQNYNMQDSTVVASANTTSASARPQLLSNGWIVTFTRLSNNTGNLHVSKDNGLTFSLLSNLNGNGVEPNPSISSKGTTVYVIYFNNGNLLCGKIDALTGVMTSGGTVDTGQSGWGASSLTINEAGTELHATWSSKNSTYPNSYNIRYAKGTINADGSVTWGAVEQITTGGGTGLDSKNPTIVLSSSGNPVIIYEYYNGASYYIQRHLYNGTSWIVSIIYDGTSYAQSSPSAIFVPQSVNGLADGRIWVAWMGADSTVTAMKNLRLSYSDDGGVTWLTMVKVSNFSGTSSTDSEISPSISANNSNEIFIGYSTRMYKSSGDTTFTEKIVFNLTKSLLFDNTFNLRFTEPLYIYKDLAKVGFYGTWKDGGSMSGTAIKTITPPDLKKWGNVKFDSVTPTDTTVTCDILDSEGNVILSNVKSFDDISAISLVNQKLKLKFSLVRNVESANSPTVKFPSVAWEGGKFVLDEVTGKKYKYKVSDGKLLMEEC